jgi:metallo-beta-lactamase class B
MITTRAAALTAALAAGALIAGPVLAREAVGPGPDGKETLSQTYRESRMDDEAFQKSVGAIKIFDNLWYVGPGYVSVWLISTPEGLILLDTAQEPYTDYVVDNIRKAGFDPKNIKYIILAHGHLDHFGGAAKIQELSGARVVAMAEDWQAIEQVGSRPGRGGQPAPRVPKRDMVAKDGDVIKLGNQEIKMYHTPGHMDGVISASYTVYDNGVPHRAWWSGGSGGRGGLKGAEQALGAANRLMTMTNDIDVATPAHAWTGGNPYPNGSIFERVERLKVRKAGEPNPFVDKAAFQTWLKINQERAVTLVAEEKAKLANGGAAAQPANAPQ